MVVPHEAAGTVAGGTASLRRRGEVLQRAIFDATLDQLSHLGWKRLTMEGVAAAAQTGKAALYRRWASKEDLVADAMRHSLPRMRDVPDNGSLRADLLDLLERMRALLSSPTGCALRVIMDEIEHEQARVFHDLIERDVREPGRRMWAAVLRRGIARGEVRADVDLELAIDVGPAMLLLNAKTCGGQVTADYPARVVDQVLLPMLQPRR